MKIVNYDSLHCPNEGHSYLYSNNSKNKKLSIPLILPFLYFYFVCLHGKDKASSDFKNFRIWLP